jgi:hypothetical protein
MRQFQASQSYSGRLIGLEAKHGPAAALDSPVILLDDIVRVMEVSSTRQDEPTGFARRFHLLLVFGHESKDPSHDRCMG